MNSQKDGTNDAAGGPPDQYPPRGPGRPRKDAPAPPQNGNVFTVIESRILNVLADGEPHPRSELLECLNDPLAEFKTVRVHLSNIRTKIKPFGGLILCVLRHRTIHYQRVKKFNFKPFVIDCDYP